MRNINKIFFKRFIAKEKFLYFIVMLLLIGKTIIDIFVPKVYQLLIDKAIPAKNINYIANYLLLLLLFFLIVFLLGVLQDYILSLISENIGYSLRTYLNNKITKLNFSFFDKNDISDLLSKYDNEIEIITFNYGYIFIRVFGYIISFISSSIMICLISWKIYIMFIPIMILYVICNIIFGKKVKALAEKNMDANKDSIGVVTENCNNVLLTKALNSYDYINNKFSMVYRRQYKLKINLEIVNSIYVCSSSFLINLFLIIVWGVGGIGVVYNNMTIGVLVTLTNYIGMLAGPMDFFCSFNNGFQKTTKAVERLMELFNYEEENTEGKEIKNKIKEIRFEHVDFGYYSENKFLEDINCSFTVGNMIGIVGLSGSGKSSFAKLLIRLYKAQKGKITINGLNMNDLKLKDIRSKITIIFQDSLFYNDTILENLKVANSVDIIQIKELLRRLDLFEEISSKPDKLNTVLSYGSTNISGGQKKRLDIIRTLLQESDVIIFDETTMSLDIERRKLLFELLNEMKKEKILLFITHNLNEIEYFDEVYLVKEHTLKVIDKNEVFSLQ